MRMVRGWEAARPVRPVRRELVSVPPLAEPGSAGRSDADGDHRPPVLMVPGLGWGAWVYEQWLDRVAERGFPAYAMSVRGHGGSGRARRATLRAYAHDVVQVAAGLPRQAVLVGHGAGALVVARALARYPARAAVLVAPVFGGPAAAGRALLTNPFGVLPALLGGRLRLPRRQLVSREVPAGQAREYAARMGRVGPLAQWQLLWPRAPEPPVGDPPVLVVGSPDDRVVSRSALVRVGQRFQVAPLLFPGMGHAPMLDARWREPVDAILDWLEKC